MRIGRVQLIFAVASVIAHVPLCWVLLHKTQAWQVSAVVGASLLITVAHLAGRAGHDAPRSRWWRFADECIFVYWAQGILALPLLAVLGLGFVLSRFVFGTALTAHAFQALAPCAYAVSFSLASWGVFVTRRWVRVTRQVIELVDLPPSFEHFTVAHLSDLHVGSTDPKAVAQRWVALANRARPDVVFVTGDLVTSGTAFYGDVCDVLGELEAPEGVFAVLGNHDQARPEVLTSRLVEQGIVVLNNTWRTLRRQRAELVIAGLDAAEVDGPCLGEMLDRRPRGLVTLLLSHYPDVFDTAAVHGVQLVFSGHTHGGQVGVPCLGDRVNLASVQGKRSRGLHVRGSAKLFVAAGLGTTNVPLRLGVRPEIALLELRRAPA